MPAEAARCHRIEGIARPGSLQHEFVVKRINHETGGGVRRGGADQPGASHVSVNEDYGCGLEWLAGAIGRHVHDPYAPYEAHSQEAPT